MRICHDIVSRFVLIYMCSYCTLPLHYIGYNNLSCIDMTHHPNTYLTKKRQIFVVVVFDTSEQLPFEQGDYQSDKNLLSNQISSASSTAFAFSLLSLF